TVLVWALPVGKTDDWLSDERAWRELGAEESSIGCAALKYFIADPDAGAKWLAKHLRPDPDAERIARLIADLDDDEVAVRQKATQELAKLGARARGALKEAIRDRPSLELLRRCKSLLAKLPEAPDAERLRTLRAIESLERMGTPAAQAVLKDLLRQRL